MLSRICSSECGRSYLGSEDCPKAKLWITALYNRVSFCSLIGHFSILLNPCRNDIMLPAEWLNWTEREIIAVAKLAREIWCRANGKCISTEVSIGNNLPNPMKIRMLNYRRRKRYLNDSRIAALKLKNFWYLNNVIKMIHEYQYRLII